MMADGDHKKYETEFMLVWDLPVRIFHWSLVIAVAGAFITNKLGVEYFKYHVWFGYAVLVLVAFRIVWGFIGTRHARFRNFLRGPKTIWRYINGRDRLGAGHNPLGALMVIVLLGGLLLQAIMGLFGNDEIFNVGPLYGYVSNELSLRLTSWHRQLFYWIAGAIGLHVIAIIFYRTVKKENLIKAMITGRKPVTHDEAIEKSRTLVAAGIVIVLSAILTWLVMSSPVALTEAGY